MLVVGFSYRQYLLTLSPICHYVPYMRNNNGMKNETNGHLLCGTCLYDGIHFELIWVKIDMKFYENTNLFNTYSCSLDKTNIMTIGGTCI